MRIGELADAAGVTTRAVRHYHRIGLLPEPPRRANGYRVYGLRDVLRLVRAHRLTELGLTLEESADVLADDEGRELPEILAELDADLARQQADIAARRARLAHLLARPGPLDADDAVSPATAELLARLAAAFGDSAAAARDREHLAMLDAHPAGEFTRAQFRRVLDDPDELARTVALYREFDDLADASADDPRIPGIAREWARFTPPEVAALPAGTPAENAALADALVADLPPAQAAVIRAALTAAGVASPG